MGHHIPNPAKLEEVSASRLSRHSRASYRHSRGGGNPLMVTCNDRFIAVQFLTGVQE